MVYRTETFLTKIDALEPNPLMMALAGQVILERGLVAFPTETVYGLGANAFNAEAVAHIFEAKGRPSNDPLIVHIGEFEQLEQVAVDIPAVAHQLADMFWPGPLTLILKRHPDIPDNVTAGQDTVAVRLPSHPIAQALIRKAGVPIAAPSANRFGRPSPTSAQHVMDDLGGHVDVILDGGNTYIGVESTILDLTTAVPTVLRPGGISLEELRKYLPLLAFYPRHILDDEIAPSPGTLLKHYSPDAQVLVFIGDNELVFDTMRHKASTLLSDEQKVGIMVLDEDVQLFEGIVAQYVFLGKDKEAMAANLFAGMRELDAAKVDVILVRAPEQEGLGLAIYDRLLRAAEGQVIEVIGEGDG
jgi:L-threonylcarbamoyladenylate synthase